MPRGVYDRKIQVRNLVKFFDLGVAHVPLTQGQFAIIDLEDSHKVEGMNWYAYYDPKMQSFYAARKFGFGASRKSVSMHVFLMRPQSGMQVDHISGVTLDNRRSNLRNVTQAQNKINRRKQSNNTSGTTGVYFHRCSKKWLSIIAFQGKRINLGLFSTKEKAWEAREKIANELHGEFRRL